MNERIQELHERAMKSCDEHRSDILNYHRIYREKFAELIIAECCVTADANIDDSKYPSYWIKRKFGVEE